MKFIEHFELAKLVNSPFAAHRAGESTYLRLWDSIKKYGLVLTLIANECPDKAGRIIDGHFRAKVAMELGIKTGPVCFIDIQDDKAERELILSLNQIKSSWNYDVLANLYSFSVMERLGFRRP